MSTAKTFGTSSPRSDRGTRKVYVSLRVMGDDLDPKQITRILKIAPTLTYAKGEAFRAGGDRERIGRTGLWLFSTDGIVASDDLHDHLAYILGVLIPGRQEARPLAQLHALLAHQKGLRADLACFWHGRYGARKPSVPKYLGEILKLIPAELEIDFATDSADADRQLA